MPPTRSVIQSSTSFRKNVSDIICFWSMWISRLDVIQVLKLYFEISETKKAFRIYLEMLFRDDSAEANRLIERNKELLHISIDLIYKYCDSPRIIVEKLLVDKKDA